MVEEEPKNNDKIKPVTEIDSNEKPKAPPVGSSADKTQTPQTQSDQGQSPAAQPPQASAPKLPKAPPVGKTSTGNKAVISRGGMGRLPKIIITVLALLIGLAAVFYFFFYKATLTINVRPEPDSITVNGQAYQQGQHKLNPGNYRIVISKDGYVSYDETKDLGINSKLSLGFDLKEEVVAHSISQAKPQIATTSDKDFIFFIDNKGKISSISVASENPKPRELSVASYPNTRELLISNDRQFALVLDDTALKIVDFQKTDLINQTETKLPPMASAINSVTWNTQTDSYFREVNSHIIYDFKTSYGWDLILANRDHSKSEILMQIDPDRFNSVSLDWGSNPKQVLIAGGELGIVDLATRSYIKISDEADFRVAKWSPDGQKAVAVDSQGNLYKIQGENVSKTGAKMSSFSWSENGNVVGIFGKKASKYNFDTDMIINYAEIEGLDHAENAIISDETIFFTDKTGLKSANLEPDPYE